MKTIQKLGLTALVLAAIACGKGKGETIGVAECDDYETKMAACADKVGGNIGDSLTKMRKMMIEPWQKQAGQADDQGKKDMAKVCTDAIKDMKKQVPQCEW